MLSFVRSLKWQLWDFISHSTKNLKWHIISFNTVKYFKIKTDLQYETFYEYFSMIYFKV